MLITQRALPPNETVDLVNEVRDEMVLVTRRRDCGGTMSRRAARRSRKVSSSRTGMSSVEISESRGKEMG